MSQVTKVLFTDDVPGADKALKRLAKKAAAYEGCSLSWVFGRSEVSPNVYRSIVTINGELPTINGWTFVARLWYAVDETLKEVSVQRRYTHDSLPEGWGESYACEHCATRRRRTAVYALINKATGERRQVGRSCLREFLGGPIEELLVVADSWEKLGVSESGYVSEVKTPDTIKNISWMRDFVLFQAICVIREHGYCSMTQARELDGNGPKPSSLILSDLLEQEAFMPFATEDAEIVVQVNAKFQESEFRYRTAFEEKLCQVLAKDYVINDDLGFICAAVSKAMVQKRTVLKEPLNKVADEYLGEVGSLIQGATVFIEDIYSYESRYGRSYIVKMMSSNCVLTWFTSNPKGLQKGNLLRKASFTIKGHELYKDQKQTTVTRMKWATG